MTTREALKAIIDELPESDLIDADAALRRVRAAAEMRRIHESVPYDDEPLTERQIAKVERSLQSLREGKGISSAELRRLIG